MRQARALKASTHDVCLLCALRFGPTSRASTTQRRRFQTNPRLLQQAGTAFKDETSFQFGSLADVVKEEKAPEPIPPETSKASKASPSGNRPQRGPTIRFQSGGRKDTVEFGGEIERVPGTRSATGARGERRKVVNGNAFASGYRSNGATSRSLPGLNGDGHRRDNSEPDNDSGGHDPSGLRREGYQPGQSSQHSKRVTQTHSHDLGPRIRFHAYKNNEGGSSVSEDVINKWQISRRNRREQTADSIPLPTTDPILTETANNNPSNPPYGSTNSSFRSLGQNTKYIPFDSRFRSTNALSNAQITPSESGVDRNGFMPRRVDSKANNPQALQPALEIRRVNFGPQEEGSNNEADVRRQPSAKQSNGARKSTATSMPGTSDDSPISLGNGYDFEPRRDETPAFKETDAARPRAQDKAPGRRRREQEDDERDTRGSRGSRKKDKGRRSSRDNDDEGGRFFDVDAYHAKKQQRRLQRETEDAKAQRELQKRREREIRLPDFISVGNLATAMKVRYERFAKTLERLGFEDVNNDFILNQETAALIVEELGFFPVTESEGPSEDIVAAPPPENMQECPPRPPIVTIMGHVDHGKTTILDFLRKSSIVASEHGGITQHIGAFSVPMSSGKNVTFLDTPGHAAFLAMRQRGANVTDIVILVVAADDSVMPQTLEAIKHARAANVPMIVALNKVDKPEANPQQVKQDLARHGVELEDYGGDIQVVEVSGKTGAGMKELEEAIVALSEVLDHRAPPDGPVEGWVLESSTKEVGKVATLLIRRGTLRSGDIIVAGTEFCRVRTMRNEFGVAVSQAGPGAPVEVDGWRGQPGAGDEVLQAPDESTASRVCHIREARLQRVDLGKDVQAINESRKIDQRRHEREKAIAEAKKRGMELPDEEDIADSSSTGVKKVYFIVKGDVAGSVEAVVDSVSALGNADVQPHILRSGIGLVTEFDIDHANAARGQIISFNSAVPPAMRAMAERAGIKILDHNIIYRLVDDVKASLEDVLTPIVRSRVTGEADVAQVFEINLKGRKVMRIAGVKVRNGTITRNSKVKVVRGVGGEVVYTGTLSSLKNVKKDVSEMAKGTECGMGFDEWEDFQVGDVAQCYEDWEEKRKL